MNNTTLNKNEYEHLAARILEKAQKQGVSDAEVSVSIETGFSVSSRLGQVETVEHHRDKGVAITVFIRQQSGSASSSDLSDEALDTIIEKACRMASYTSSDPCSGLADRDLLAFDYPELDLDFPSHISTESALESAIECESIAMSCPRITNSEGVSISSHRSLQVYANTKDFLGSYFSTQYSANCILIAQDGNQMHRDYEFTVARDSKDLMPMEKLAKEAADKVGQRIGSRRLKTVSAPVIFTTPVARSLLGNFVSAISGHNIYRNSSFLLNQLHNAVFPNHITLVQFPHLAKAVGSLPFDHEGVRTKEQNFVSDGVLQNYILGSYSARKLGLKSTGNAGGVQNLQISLSDLTLEQLLVEMGTGLLVTELIGQGVNLVTGDYSRGAFGFWVENGHIQYPVEEITIAGNLKDIFMNVVAVSKDLDTRGKIRTGSILISEMMIAGQ